MGLGELAELVSLDSKAHDATVKRLAASSSPLEAPEEEAYCNDPDLVLAAVANRPKAMLRASEELRSDETFALEVVHRNWRALEFLPQSLRSNRTVALAAARQHAGALEFTSGEVREDPNLMIALREGLRLQNVGRGPGKSIPSYEGECLRLVGYCNDWRPSDSRLRLTRVASSQARAPEATSEEGEADGGETQFASLAGGAGNDVPPGIIRHRLTAHLSQGFLSFQVVSCLHHFACRIYPTGGCQDGFFVLPRKNNEQVTAGWGGTADGTGHNFYIVEMAGTVVNIYVDIHEGSEDDRSPLQMPKVEVWYEVETAHRSGQILTLSQAADRERPKLPKRVPRISTLVEDSPASNEVRVVMDPEADKQYNDVVMEARGLSKANYNKRFYIRDLVGSRHLALLVDRTCSRTFGYCLYDVNTSKGEMYIEQLVVSESLRGTLMAWISAQAESAGQTIVERHGDTRSDAKVPLLDVRRRTSMTQPDYPAFVVEAHKGAKLFENQELGGSVYALLPKGVPVFGERRQGVVELRWPVPGSWVDRNSLTEVHASASISRRSLACGELFALMHQTRLDVTGPDPLGKCIISSNALCVDIVASSVDRYLGAGPCRVMQGSFRTRPNTLCAFEKHWFVMFGNGTIADVTADQFDEVIKLWYPADASRYALWVGDQHIDLTQIETGKIGKGIKWATNALGWAPVRD